MCNYMTDLSRIYVDPEENVSFACKGHDLESLLFKFLDEILYKFCTDSFCPKAVEIVDFNRETFSIEVKMYLNMYYSYQETG
jgi:SHS2 domain-containing protein